MEMSSPLAAMHPPPVPWGHRRDLFAGGIGSKNLNFNFRDMSMKKPQPDYFALAKPLQGSSPTASLAADMSSNLHVDQSPQFSTPRRSLFTSNYQQLDKQAEGTTTPPVAWEGVTTPDVASSSPCFVNDSMDMDISPLPHKAPYSYITEQQPLASPTPEASPMDEDMASPCEMPTPPAYPGAKSEEPTPVPAADRRKPLLSRPSLTRAKNYSTNTVSFKSKENNVLPTFKFGAGVNTFSASSSASSPALDECFAASPDRKSWPNNLVGPKTKLFANKNTALQNLPNANINRKPTGPPGRQRSKMRRSLSMFENPGEVMNPKEEHEYQPSGLQSVMDMEDTPSLKLPHFTPTEPESLPRISDATLINILNGEYDDMYDNKIIIDCRFEYEYNGGHIDGARNFCDKDQLAEVLFNANVSPKTLLIFHCEYSAHRAPLMAKFVRHEDRKVNSFRYPQLSYPEMYILDGGYSAFFESHRTRCFPQNYLRMDAKEHESACERGMHKLRQRAKLNRAQTFAAFGSPSSMMEDSPSAVGRTTSTSMLCNDESPNCGRLGLARRLASY